MTEKALNRQVGGGHYKKFAIQPFEFIHANGIPFAEANIIKYACRWRDKGGIESLNKIKHYVDLIIEMEGLDNDEATSSLWKADDALGAIENTYQKEDDEFKVGRCVRVVDSNGHSFYRALILGVGMDFLRVARLNINLTSRSYVPIGESYIHKSLCEIICKIPNIEGEEHLYD